MSSLLSNHCSITSSSCLHFPPSPLSCSSPESVVTCRAHYLSFMCFNPEFNSDLIVFAGFKCYVDCVHGLSFDFANGNLCITNAGSRPGLPGSPGSWVDPPGRPGLAGFLHLLVFLLTRTGPARRVDPPGRSGFNNYAQNLKKIIYQVKTPLN